MLQEEVIRDGILLSHDISVRRVLEAVLSWCDVEPAAERLGISVEEVRAALAYAVAHVRVKKHE